MQEEKINGKPSASAQILFEGRDINTLEKPDLIKCIKHLFNEVEYSRRINSYFREIVTSCPTK